MKIFLLIAIIGDASNCTPFLQKQRFFNSASKKVCSSTQPQPLKRQLKSRSFKITLVEYVKIR